VMIERIHHPVCLEPILFMRMGSNNSGSRRASL
jgi:hypothetical protein